MRPKLHGKWVLEPTKRSVIRPSFPKVATSQQQVSTLWPTLGHMRLQRQGQMSWATSKLVPSLLLTKIWDTGSNDLLNFFLFIVQKFSNIEVGWRRSGHTNCRQSFLISRLTSFTGPKIFLGLQMRWRLSTTNWWKFFQVTIIQNRRFAWISFWFEHIAGSLTWPPIFQGRRTSEDRLLHKDNNGRSLKSKMELKPTS